MDGKPLKLCFERKSDDSAGQLSFCREGVSYGYVESESGNETVVIDARDLSRETFLINDMLARGLELQAILGVEDFEVWNVLERMSAN